MIRGDEWPVERNIGHLPQGQPRKREDPDPPRERFTDIPHHPELLRSGQEEQPLFVPLVYDHLHHREKRRCALHLVDEYRRREVLEERRAFIRGGRQAERIVQ
ncbi:hypothetical protein SDC9_208958 [bioreactor metagenome]|uniref:Uncharacterized protein n=1 Tax=bioreactor metagenome TaxID=1076179 RepID=A0A645JLN0_9ZZZZ